MFVLNSLIQLYLNENKRLYCAFVDFRKAFDCVNRNALWLKMYKSGIGGKCLRIIKDMYSHVKARVKYVGNFSDTFEITIGLKQGEVISPMLWALFVEDLEMYLQNNLDSGISLNEIIIILLLFADDMIIFGNSPVDLQNSLNKLYDYCQNWSLEVNTEKTKIMIFRKKGKPLPHEQFYYNGIRLENIDHFNYLGTVFSYTGNFQHNQEQLIGKSLKALNVLLINCRKYNLKPKLLCELFDSFVGSILSYGAEIFGFSKSKEMERIHLKFCKSILNVRKSTCNAAVYAELGRYPLYIIRYVKILKYWFKVMNTENIILRNVYDCAYKQCIEGRKNWVSDIKKLLTESGFAYVWENPLSVSQKEFALIFKQRLIDNFIQGCFATISASPSLHLYKYLKENCSYERYLDILPSSLRTLIFKLRTSSHSLRIQTGRFGPNRILRNERICIICNSGDIEDEFHFILKCPFYHSLRKRYIKEYFYKNPSTLKLLKLLCSNNKSELFNLALYAKQAFIERMYYFHMINNS